MVKRLKKLFIPHEHNEYKPDFFREWSLVVVGIIILSLFLISSFLQFNLQVNSSILGNVISSVMVDLTNEDRAKNGLNRLAVSDKLALAAKLKAQDMAEKGYFAHTSPDGDTPWHWFDQAGYSYQHAGENLAVHFSDSKAVEEAWMNSPTHRANILNGRYSEVGIATVEGYYQGYKTTFVVQMFGTPRLLAEDPTEEPPSIAGVPEPEPEPVIQEETAETVLGSTNEEEPVEVSRSDVENQQFVAVSVAPSVAGEQVGPLKRAIASPKHTFEYILLFAGGFIALALLIMIVIEIRRQHAWHIVYALLLLLFIVLLYILTQEGFITKELLID